MCNLHNQKDNIEFKFDKIAINRLKNGDAIIFEKIFRFFFQPLLEFANYYLQNEQDSENIVQDVFFHLWKNKEKLNSDIDLKAFLYKAIKNKSLNYKRHLKIKRKFVNSNIYIPDTVEMPDENMHRKDIEKGIAQAIQNLPEKRRIIFCMHRFEKLTYKEIAKIQGISIKTVETQIQRSLLFLEKQLSRFLHSIII